MNSKTKIVVIHMKALIIGIAAAVIFIFALIFFIMSASSKPSEQQGGSNAKTTSSSGVFSDNTAGTYNENVYTPGVYTASISLNGSPVDIQVTVDKNNINSIEMIHVSDEITTMYPLLSNNFKEIADAVKASGTTKNITYSSESKYTSVMLLNAISSALDKAKISK